MARSQDVGYLFDKECENLNYLREKSVDRRTMEFVHRRLRL